MYVHTSHLKGDKYTIQNIYFFFAFFFSFSFFFRAAPAYGGSQARGQIGAVAASLCYATATATPDPQLTEQGQGSNLQPHGS